MTAEEHKPQVDRLTNDQGTFFRAWCACGWAIPWTVYQEAVLGLGREHQRTPELFMLSVKERPT